MSSIPQKQTLPPQHQDQQPGIESKMTPRPVTVAPHYKASGKLKGKPFRQPGRAGHPCQWCSAGADLDTAHTVHVSRRSGRCFRRQHAHEATRSAGGSGTGLRLFGFRRRLLHHRPVHPCERGRNGKQLTGFGSRFFLVRSPGTAMKRNQPASLPRAGSVTVKLDPTPSSLSTRIRPPWASTIHFAMDRPKPVPSISRERILSPR